MADISFFVKDGIEYAKWPGKSARVDGKIVKNGQMYLGKVINKNDRVFYSKDRGYFRFDPSDQSFHELGRESVKMILSAESLLPSQISTVRFGGSYFLGKLIPGIEYDQVLNMIKMVKSDRLNAMLHYYLLTDTADMHAGSWYQNSYAKFLYPDANLYSQRISEFYESIGRDDANRVVFLEKHIEYVLQSTDDECCIIVDSTGCQNACSVPITRVSRHENEVNIEFREILVVQRSTGLPLYYEIIQGNVVDIATTMRIKLMLEALGLKVTDILGDAGYACPANMERLILAGTDFMMRLCPNYNLYKNALRENLERLLYSDDVKTVLYRNRYVKVIKVSSIIGRDRETGEDKNGFVYLCLDLESHHLKNSHLYRKNKKRKNPYTEEELKALSEKNGVFAIVDTRDLSEEDVLPEYYMRQGVEQFFDYAKNYGKMMPVRNHNMDTIRGHMMISVIATFFCVLIKNRMNLMDTEYCCIPDNLRDKTAPADDTVLVDTENGSDKLILIQTPLLDVYESSAGALFNELELVNAVYFPENKNIDRARQLIPETPHKNAKDFTEAFGLVFPEKIEIGENDTLLVYYDKDSEETCTRARAFTIPTTLEEAAIQAAMKKAIQQETMPEEKQEPAPVKKRGRPPGSKNKKTLEKTAEEPAVQKRGRGRPPGSKNKKPLEQSAREDAGNSEK